MLKCQETVEYWLKATEGLRESQKLWTRACWSGMLVTSGFFLIQGARISVE